MKDSCGCRVAQSIVSSAVRRRKIENWRAFRMIVRKCPSNFSALQTVWRSRQSGANLSLTKFPANREFNREFLKIMPSKTALSFSNLHILQEKNIFCSNPSREFLGTYQGINRDVSGNFRDLSGNLYSLVCDVGRQAFGWDGSSENQ